MKPLCRDERELGAGAGRTPHAPHSAVAVYPDVADTLERLGERPGPEPLLAAGVCGRVRVRRLRLHLAEERDERPQVDGQLGPIAELVRVSRQREGQVQDGLVRVQARRRLAVSLTFAECKLIPCFCTHLPAAQAHDALAPAPVLDADLERNTAPAKLLELHAEERQLDAKRLPLAACLDPRVWPRALDVHYSSGYRAARVLRPVVRRALRLAACPVCPPVGVARERRGVERERVCRGCEVSFSAIAPAVGG